jgi:hypothetical protein
MAAVFAMAKKMEPMKYLSIVECINDVFMEIQQN